MELDIPKNVLSIYESFGKNGFEVFFVGGCVRNLLMGRGIKDWDLTTDAVPQDILKLYPHGFYDNNFGTVGIPAIVDDIETVVEVTTYRTEREYSDKRRPDKVEWGKTIEEDLQRRDFTINAIAMQLSKNAADFSLVDPYKGAQDLKDKILRAVGDPDVRFKEDALRLLRAIRIATELSFSIEDQTLKAISEDAKLIESVSGERIKTELFRILSGEFAYDGLMLLKNTNLLAYILPELIEGIGVSQQRPGRHHTTDVFTHNVLSMKECPSQDPLIRFAALIHDIGKPRVQSTDEQGLVIFHNHEIVGAKIARDIADRLKFSKKERDKLITLIRWHMFTVDEHITDAAVRRFIRRIGIDNVKDMMDLRIGDRLGGGTQTAESWRLKLFKKRVEEQLQPAPFSINDLAIDGNDVMKELNMEPGPKVGEILQKLFEEVDENLELNNKEYLIKRVNELS